MAAIAVGTCRWFRRQVQVEGAVFRSGHPEQAGVQILQVHGRSVHALRHQAQIDRVIDFDGVERDGLILLKMIQARTARDSWP